MSYINHARLGFEPLDDVQLSRIAPSIFARGVHESRSDRYTFIPTSEIVAAMRAEGFVPYSAFQGRSRVPGKAEFTKHMVRFRHISGADKPRRVGQVHAEIVLRNSHDGTSQYELDAGLFRLVCLNGMVASDRTFESVRVPHKGRIIDNVVDGSFEVLSESIRALDMAEHWSTIELSRDEQMAIAEGAHWLRFADSSGEVTTPITPAQLLSERRMADRGNDLWTVTNRLQENIIRGGIQAWGTDANNRRRHATMRAVNGIDQNVKLNQGLWAIAEQMAELKAA